MSCTERRARLTADHSKPTGKITHSTARRPARAQPSRERPAESTRSPSTAAPPVRPTVAQPTVR